MGKVFVWGGGQVDKPTFVPFLSNMNVIQVAASSSDVFYVLSDVGEVCTFTIGSLSNTSKQKYEKIDLQTGVKEKVIMILPSEGSLYALTNLGRIIHRRQLNMSYTTEEFNPPGAHTSKVVKISSGDSSSIIVERENGMKSVLTFGMAGKKTTPTRVFFERKVPLLLCGKDKAFYTDGIDSTLMHNVSDNKFHKGELNWIGGSVRDHHSIFVSADGYVYSLGLNYETLLCGETMLEDKKITKLSVLRNVENVYQCRDNLYIHGKNKHYFCLARTNTGQLFAWGGNQEKQLGISSERPHAIFPCLITSLYGLKIAQADCGRTVAIALSENFSNAFSDSLNKEGLSDVKIELYANNTSTTKEIYLHKCILLARCPSFLNLVLSEELNYCLRCLLMDYKVEEHEISSVNIKNTNNTENIYSRVECTDPNNPNQDFIELIYNALMVLFNYLYVDEIDYLSVDLETNREAMAMVQKLINFFYFLELKYWNDKEFIGISMVKELRFDRNLLKTFEEWNFSSIKYENMSLHNRLVRAFTLDSGNSKIDLKFAEHRIGNHLQAIMGREDTCEDYKLTLQSKDQVQVSIPLHKVILTNSIEFFKGVFESNMEEKTRGEMILTMEENEDSYLFQLENVIPLLFHAYCGAGDNENQTKLFMDRYHMTLTLSNACECLAVANYYASREFKAENESFISQFITVEAIVPLLLVCETHEAYSLKEVCIDFAAVNFEKVQLIKEFHKELPHETKDYIIKIARKRSKKMLDLATLEKYWKNEISESELFPNPTPINIVATSSNPPPQRTSTSTSRSRNSSIFSKIANFFSK